MDINRNDSDEFFGASDDGGAIGQPDEGGQDNTGEYGDCGGANTQDQSAGQEEQNRFSFLNTAPEPFYRLDEYQDSTSGGRFKRFFFNNRFIFMAAGVSAAVLLIVFIVHGIFPFGGKTVLRIDLYHQYAPFFQELYKKLTTGDTIVYSLFSGLGNNFLCNFFNYLCSPFSLLIFLFGERYITEELKNLENQILGAEENVINLEYNIFVEVRDKIEKQVERLQKAAEVISILDCLCSLAQVAEDQNYVRPQVDNSGVIDITEGRHPVIEKILPSGSFVSNDTYLDKNENRLSIITGPNMAGKSTYMRQVALITLLAQVRKFCSCYICKNRCG